MVLPCLTPASHAERWARSHRRFLGLVHMRFEQSGDWPNAARLQREVTHVHDDLDVIGCAESLPRRLGSYLPDGRIALSVRALAHVDDADDLIGGFLRALRLAVRRYREDEGSPSPVLREADLANLVHGDGGLSRLLALLAVERGVFGPVDDEAIAVEITPDARHFVGVRTLRGYLAVLDRLARASGRRRRRNPLLWASTWLRRRPKTIGEWIVIGLVSSMIAAICLALISNA